MGTYDSDQPRLRWAVPSDLAGGPFARAYKSATLFNHYFLLATAEQLLGLPGLGLAAAYPAMTTAFNL